MKLFGYEISMKRDEDDVELKSFVQPQNDDGAKEFSTMAYGGINSYQLDLDGSVKTENQLINKYRELALLCDVDTAIQEIVNESIVTEEQEYAVQLDLSNVEISEKLKDMIREEFENILDIFNFKMRGSDIFRQWYIDGRIYYHVVINEEKPEEGIYELRFIDPRKIKKIREYKQIVKNDQTNVLSKEDYVEYYIYSDDFFTGQEQQNNWLHNKNTRDIQGLKIASDSIVYSNSGIVDAKTGVILSYLHKAIRPSNQLKHLEDAVVIYRLTRAPEKRAFYVDVGDLPKGRAEQYMNTLMNKYRTKMTYDAATGDIQDFKRVLAMTEDYWIPRRAGSTGTSIDVLQGGQSLGEIDDVEYFRKKLAKALNVPYARLNPEDQAGFTIGRSSEISRDEVKFSKFISKLRMRFTSLFEQALRQQLLLKNIIDDDSWEEIRGDIHFDYNKDTYFAELKNAELLRERISLLRDIEQYEGRFFTTEQIYRDVLCMTEDDIEELKKFLKKNKIESEDKENLGAFRTDDNGDDYQPIPTEPEKTGGRMPEEEPEPEPEEKQESELDVKLSRYLETLSEEKPFVQEWEEL